LFDFRRVAEIIVSRSVGATYDIIERQRGLGLAAVGENGTIASSRPPRLEEKPGW